MVRRRVPRRQRLARSLKRRHRQVNSGESRAACRKQFATQRLLFHQKVRYYWSDAIASYSNDARALWSKINKLCNPPSARQLQHTASDLASHFVGKVEKIQASTATADPLNITPHTALYHCHASRCNYTTPAFTS